MLLLLELLETLESILSIVRKDEEREREWGVGGDKGRELNVIFLCVLVCGWVVAAC